MEWGQKDSVIQCLDSCLDSFAGEFAPLMGKEHPNVTQTYKYPFLCCNTIHTKLTRLSITAVC